MLGSAEEALADLNIEVHILLDCGQVEQRRRW